VETTVGIAIFVVYEWIKDHSNDWQFLVNNRMFEVEKQSV